MQRYHRLSDVKSVSDKGSWAAKAREGVVSIVLVQSEIRWAAIDKMIR